MASRRWHPPAPLLLTGALFFGATYLWLNLRSDAGGRRQPASPATGGDGRLLPKCGLPGAEGLASSHANATAFGLKLAAEHTRTELEAAGTGPRKILLVAYHRGGSTFLGEILNAYPGAFLHFEPLYILTENRQVRSRAEVAESLRLLRHLFGCRFGAAMASHFRWPVLCRWYFQFNLPRVAGCPVVAPLCFSPGFFDTWCAAHGVQAAKVLRLRLERAGRLLEAFPDLRLVHLTRDPRGLYNSRRRWGWCAAQRACIEPRAFCADMRRDLAAAEDLRRRFPGRFLSVRYDDLANDTEGQVGRLLVFLGLPGSSAVDAFVRAHTQASRPRETGEKPDGLLTTYRDSKTRPLLWMEQLPRAEVARVEAACGNVIRQLGFQLTSLKAA